MNSASHTHASPWQTLRQPESLSLLLVIGLHVLVLLAVFQWRSTSTPPVIDVLSIQMLRASPPVEAPVKPIKEEPALAPAVVPPRFDAAYLNNPTPSYPALSRRNGETGRVMLRVQVGADGLPKNITIAESSLFPRLDEAALAAVKRWRFVPAKQGDQAITEWVLVPLNFKLTR